MRGGVTLRLAACLLAVVCCLLSATAQNTTHGYLRFDLPTDVCAGTTQTFRFGYNAQFNVVFDLPQASQSHAERAFLPDGVPCSPYGCSYRSNVTFSSFAPGATLTSVQDIKYVRVNMEHSWIGDLYIGIVCPNGQRASLMNWSGDGSSSCDDEVPAGHRTWVSGSNVSNGTYLGNPYDYSNSLYPCDSTNSNNQPGSGWNYCWSNNTTSGYQYASGDGRIYRLANRTGSSIDSSNVALGRKFYHPDQNFSSLTGCPLNGNWYIEVIDAWSGDNGWIFDWELALNPTLLPTDCALLKREVIGARVTRQNDSTYRFSAPSVTHDSVFPVTFRIVSTCGDTIDSTAYITVHPKYNITEYDTACDSYTLFGQTYTHDIMVVKHFTSVGNCDSTMRYRLHILHSDQTEVHDTVLQNQLPYVVDGETLVPALPPLPPYPSGGATLLDTTLLRTNRTGCDSTVSMTLFVWYNIADTVDSTVCRHQLPLTWNGVEFGDAGQQTITLTGSHGVDSLLTMRVAVIEDTRLDVHDTVLENQLPWGLDGHETFAGDTATEYMTVNAGGCDSLITYSLHVWRNSLDSIDSTVCRHQLPIEWNGLTFADAGVQTLMLADVHGADSVTVMTLAVNEDNQGEWSDTVVENNLPWPGVEGFEPLTGATDTLYLLQNAAGCDSLLHYSLHVWWNRRTEIDSSVCRHELPVVWNGETFDDGGTKTVTLAENHGADSLVAMTLSVREDTYNDIKDTVVENNLPWMRSGIGTFDTIADTTIMLANAQGCDSTVSFSLHVWYNVEESFDTVVCDNVWPLVWRGARFNGGGIAQRTLYNAHGADSTVHLTVTAMPVYDSTIEAETCDNTGYVHDGQTLRRNGVFRFMYTTAAGCDSLIRVSLKVWPTASEKDYDTVCLSELPYSWEGQSLSYGGKSDITSTVMMATVHGCDSVRSLCLAVKGIYLMARPHITPTVVTLEDPKIVFNDNSRDATSRLWIVDDYQTDRQSFSYIYTSEADSLPVTLIAYNTESCTDTARTVIRLDRSALIAPNVFTPDQEINNHWFVATTDITEIHVWIYNRHGNLVGEYTDIDGYWDGHTLDGHPCPQGAYVYKVQYRTKVHPDRLQDKTGTLLLLK